MRLQNIFVLSAIMLAATVAGGCSKNQSVVVTITADEGTNVTTITTNGYTVMMGSTVVGTNIMTNTSAGPRPSP
jgi:hypothetical protein